MSKTVASPEEVGIFKALDRYLFGYGSPVTIGLFRALMGTMIFLNLVFIGSFWKDWFSEEGYVPAWMGQVYMYPSVRLNDTLEIPRINLLNGVTDPRITAPFFLLVTVSALFTALGLWTRVSTFILAIGLVSIQHRNAAILHGGDNVMRVMAIYLMLAPSGAACSIDRLVGLWKGTVPRQHEAISLWPQRLIAYNVALLYLTTTWLKYWGNLWVDGTATYYPARLAEFARFPVPAFINDLPMVKVTTYGTLIVEFALGTLVFFRPLRKWVLLTGVMLHLYIDFTMNIPLFSWIMMSTYLSFYEGEEISGWAKRVGARLRKFHVVAHLPMGQALKSGSAAFLEAVDPFGLVDYVPGDGQAWSVTASGATKPTIFSLFTRSVGTWIFGWIPGVWKRILAGSLEPREVPTEKPKPSKRTKSK